MKKKVIMMAFVGIFIISMSLRNTKALSITELKSYSLGACYCCNATGGADCSGDGSIECPSQPKDPMDPFPEAGWINTGTECVASSTTWALDGADDADCDNALLNPAPNTCAILEPTIFCSNYYQEACENDFIEIELGDDPECGIVQWWCNDGANTLTGTSNNSRLQCTGTACWW